MTPEARAFLDQLDELALKNDQTSKDVMAVLTALRSYDSDENGLKSVSTIPIRRAALPRCAALVDKREITQVKVGDNHEMRMTLDDPADEGRVDCRSLDIDRYRPYARRKPPSIGERHFFSHAMDAAKALGLRFLR